MIFLHFFFDFLLIELVIIIIYSLVNPLNTKIGAPVSGIGRAGMAGFVTYSDVCWFKRNNIFVTEVFDEDTCSPYMFSGTEWMSYENERSLTCKANYVRDNDFGGVMIFSLNTDDYGYYCFDDTKDEALQEFPLVRKIKSILFK